MPGRSRRPPSKTAIKAAADRAEARSRGEEPFPTDPELKAKFGKREDTREGGGAPASDPLDPPETSKSGAGRPTDYKPEFCDIAVDACARGATIAELAEILGCHRATVHRWMAQHQKFRDSIKIAGEFADERVGFSLYERAVGYSYNSVKIMSYEGTPVVVPYVEHVPPDTNAARYWLNNRKPEQWRDRKEITGTVEGGSTVIIDNRGQLDEARRVAFALGRAFERSKDKDQVIEHQPEAEDAAG